MSIRPPVGRSDFLSISASFSLYPHHLFISLVLVSSSLSVAASISAKTFPLLPFPSKQASPASRLPQTSLGEIAVSTSTEHHHTIVFIITSPSPPHQRHQQHVTRRRSEKVSVTRPAGRQVWQLARAASLTAPSRWSCCSWSRWAEGAPSAPAGPSGSQVYAPSALGRPRLSSFGSARARGRRFLAGNYAFCFFGNVVVSVHTIHIYI